MPGEGQSALSGAPRRESADDHGQRLSHAELLISRHLGKHRSTSAVGKAFGHTDLTRTLRLAREKQGLPTLSVMVDIAEQLDIDTLDVVVACAADAGVALRSPSQPKVLREVVECLTNMPPKRQARLAELLAGDD